MSNFIIAFFLLIGTALCSLPPVSAWYCEGKPCGITLWACCCAVQTTEDGKCRTPAPDLASDDSLCAAGCGCARVMSIAPDCDHAPPPAALAFEPFVALAALPTPVGSYIPPALTQTGEQGIEARGPPARRIAHRSHGLRAPPAA